jgi:two-component system cell cycle response regulator
MRVKLATAFYDVMQAASGKSALVALKRHRPDLVIASSNLPDMTGQAFCAALRRHAVGSRLPVILILGEDLPEERLAALAAGADDVLSRPVDDLVLLARLRSLLRARDAESELELREDTRRALGLAEPPSDFAPPARVALVPACGQEEANRILQALREALPDRIDLIEPDDVLRDRSPAPDVFILLESGGQGGEGLAMLPQLRSRTDTRHSALIYVAYPHQRREAAAALDMGANDLLANGPNIAELALRIRKQAARKRTADRLRANMRDGLRAALTDPLTGLYNRRYALPHMKRLAERSVARGRSYALLVADLDHFKRVNDVYGHSSGDAVLVELAERLRNNLRAADLIARLGGEEFLIVMPDASREAAKRTAERLCAVMTEQPVPLPDGGEVRVTLSIGVAVGHPNDGESPETLVDKADRALYGAKSQGRNMVVMADTVTRLLAPGATPLPPTYALEGDEARRKAQG